MTRHRPRRIRRRKRKHSKNVQYSKYYHTHRYNIHDAHWSEMCNTPAVGHYHDATFADNKGGSQKNHNLVV